MKNLITAMAYAVVFGLFATSCEEEIEQIQSIEIESNKKVHVGDKGVLDINYTPNYLSAPICNWTSSDSSIVAIDCYTGEYIVKNVGTAVITVMTSELSLMDQCEFKSSLHRDHNILSLHNCSLYENESIILEISPYWDIENSEWLSTDNSIATVDKNGKVTAVGEGVCNIVLVTSDNSKDYCKFSVEKFYKVDDLTFDVTEKEIELGENFTITAFITPNNSSNKNLYWSSSDSTVAKVDEYGRVYSVNEGECYIYARSHNDKVAECKVVVIPASVKSVELNINKIKLLLNDSQKVEFTITPSYAKITDVEWNVEDETIASVIDGVITAKQLGETAVQVVVNKQNFAKCYLKVCDIDEFVSVSVSGTLINGAAVGGVNTWLYNNSSKTIVAKSIQLIDGITGRKGNVMSLEDENVYCFSKIGYKITTPLTFYYPICRWVYVYNNKEYVAEDQLGKEWLN